MLISVNSRLESGKQSLSCVSSSPKMLFCPVCPLLHSSCTLNTGTVIPTSLWTAAPLSSETTGRRGAASAECSRYSEAGREEPAGADALEEERAS